MRINDILVEFAPAGGGGSGDYFQALASAWYNGTFDTGSLQKGIKSQQDVERLLNRGIVAPDGKMRKYHIDYSSDFDGVEIYSDDYYEYGDYDDTIDSRTGQKWGPYDFMAFSDEDLSEGINEFAADDGDSGGEDDALHKYARMWWAGDEATQMQIEAVLARMGWEIGEDEGGYDNGGVFVVRAGDINGDSYTSWAAEDLTEGMSEATGDEKFDTMMGQIQREPKYPDSQMPPTDVKDLYQWAVKNNKPYHKIFAEWANREGYKSVAPALMKAGDLDTEALDYWTPRVWKIYWGEVRGIDSEMPPEWSKKRVPDELRDYLETVFDAYDRIVFDWPTEYRQIGGQDNYAEGASIVSRKSPLGPTRLTSIRKAYLATKLYIDEELFEQHQPFEDLDNNTQGQVYDLLMQARDGFFHGNAKMALEALRSVNDLCDDLDDNVYAFIKHKTGVDIFNLDSTKDQGMAEGWREESQDLEDWAKEVNKKLYKAHASQRPALAQQLSQLEHKHFGSPANPLTRIVKSALTALRNGQMPHYDSDKVGAMPFGSLVGDDAKEIAAANLHASENQGYSILKRNRIVDTVDDFLRLVDVVQTLPPEYLFKYKDAGGQAWFEIVKDIGWSKDDAPGQRYRVSQGVAEGNPKSEPPEADYGADYQDMVSRVKKLAGLGPLKTVYDPQKRVYKNVPTAVQPKKEQR